MSSYDVIGAAKDGQEAVNMYIKFPSKPEVTIMDHRIPIKNGIEATKEILENSGNPKPKILFASVDCINKEERLAIGASSFKDEPFKLERLFKNVNKLISDGLIKNSEG